MFTTTEPHETRERLVGRSDWEVASTPARASGRVAVVTECHRCGYEAEGPGAPPRQCPKCGAASWTRFARLVDVPGSHPGEHRSARGTYRRSFDRPTYHVSCRRGHALTH